MADPSAGSEHRSRARQQFGLRPRAFAVVIAVAVTAGAIGTVGASSAQAARPSSVAAAAGVTAATTTSRLDVFDAGVLGLINARRATAGLVPLSETLELDQMSEAWSDAGAAKGLYGTIGSNTGLATQVAALGLPGTVGSAQSVAKWFPRTVKVADVFAMFVGYPDALSKMMNPTFRYVGIDTVLAPDGTSVATLTYTDSAGSAQVVNPVILLAAAASSTSGQG